jgi:hypothetical protein
MGDSLAETPSDDEISATAGSPVMMGKHLQNGCPSDEVSDAQPIDKKDQ